MASTIELLQRAAQERLPISITYNGGSKPGETRQLLPVRVADGSLSAREPGVASEKMFKLAKISRVVLPNGDAADNALVEPISSYKTPVLSSLSEYAEYLRPLYESKGWNVVTDAERFGVGRFLKNGKPRKSLAIYVSFQDRTTEELLEFKTMTMVERPRELTGRERPWRVDSDRQPQGKSFKELHVAMEFLATEVSLSSP
jgi:hypothetical protein